MIISSHVLQKNWMEKNVKEYGILLFAEKLGFWLNKRFKNFKWESVKIGSNYLHCNVQNVRKACIKVVWIQKEWNAQHATTVIFVHFVADYGLHQITMNAAIKIAMGKMIFWRHVHGIGFLNCKIRRESIWMLILLDIELAQIATF